MSARGVDLIVRGGRIVTATDVFEAAVAIKRGAIVAIGPEEMLPPADRVIDAAGKIVFPGLIDCHLHVGPEYDDWKTSALAAARTGLTTLVPFVTCDDGERLPAHAALPEFVRERLLDHVANRPLRVRAARVERHFVQLVPRQLGSADDEADLRPVAVGDDHVVARFDDVGDVMARLAGERPLIRDGAVPVVADERVAADRQHDEIAIRHVRASGGRRRGYG